MKKLNLMVLVIASVSMLALTGCYSKAQKGTAIGAGTGALVGGAVGGRSGAAVGAAVGGVSGAAIGHNEDRKDRRRYYRY